MVNVSDTEREQAEREKWREGARENWEKGGGVISRAVVLAFVVASVLWLPERTSAQWLGGWVTVLAFIIALANPVLILPMAAAMFVIPMAHEEERSYFLTRQEPGAAMLYVAIVAVCLLLPPFSMLNEEWAWRMKKKFR